MDFLKRPLLPAPDKLVLTDISALLALLVEGTPNETVTNLLAAPANRDLAMKTWTAWKPFLSHHPLFPIAEAQVKKDILKILATAYASPVAREAAAEYLRAYAESALTSAAFIDHTDYTVEAELPLVRPHPIAMSLQTAVLSLTMPFSLTRVRTPSEGTPSKPSTSGPILTGACDGVPYDPRGLAGRYPQPDLPTYARLPLHQPGKPTSRHHPTMLERYITAPRAQAPLCNTPPHPIGADTLTSTNSRKPRLPFANPHAHTQTRRNSSPPHIQQYQTDPGTIPGPAQTPLYAYCKQVQHLLGGGTPHSTPEEERPHARKYRTITCTPQSVNPPNAGSTAAPGPAPRPSPP